jgi:hypothetical protein
VARFSDSRGPMSGPPGSRSLGCRAALHSAAGCCARLDLRLTGFRRCWIRGFSRISPDGLTMRRGERLAALVPHLR